MKAYKESAPIHLVMETNEESIIVLSALEAVMQSTRGREDIRKKVAAWGYSDSDEIGCLESATRVLRKALGLT
jgi:hypothetical protein